MRDIFIALAIFASGVSHAQDAGLQHDIELILSEEGLAGIAWSLVDSDGAVSLGAAGLSDNLNRTPFTTGTRLHVGSLAKAVLATGVLRLVTEGRIALDAPALTYLQDVEFNNPWQRSTPVTVRHLLDHTTGLDDARLWQMFSERANPDSSLNAAFPNQREMLRIRTEPGSRFSYSNMGYTLLGLIIESVSGRRYEAYLDEQVLAPLNMLESTFSFTTQTGERADPTLAWGHVDDGSRAAAAPIFLRPAGQFTTTASDLARFAQFLMSDGTMGDQSFIATTLMRARGSPFQTEAANSGLNAGYGLGLARRDRHAVVGICHGGNIVGFSARLCFFPDDGRAFAYSTNTDSETADYGRLDKRFIAALGIAAAAPPAVVDSAPDISDWVGHYILSPNRFQSFAYLDLLFGVNKVIAGENSLVLTSIQRSPRTLRAAGGYLFSANDRSTVSHVLLRGKAGEYVISDGFQTLEKASTTYLIAHWLSAILGLAAILWIFFAGAVSLVRNRMKFFGQPQAPAFYAVLLLLVPVPFFFAQSFMALGDLTLASGLLAAVTALLPVAMIWNIARAVKSRSKTKMMQVHALAAACVLQWCAVLAFVGMLPLRLWA